MAENNRSAYTPPQVEHRVEKPRGILPSNLQPLLLGGLALAMVLVIAFANHSAPRPRSTSEPPVPSAVDPNAERIREYQERIEEQARKLALEQAKLAQTKQAASRALESVGTRPGEEAGGASPMPSMSGGETGSPMDAERHWREDDQAKREYESRYAPPTVLTHRTTGRLTASPVRPAADVTAITPADVKAPATDTRALESRPSSPKQYRLFEGTILETVLTNRLDGSFSGPVNCLVTTSVYSHDRTKLLIPQGSRVLGEVGKVEAFGQQRLAVTFSRLIMPDGFSVPLEKLPALSAVGETGLVDQVNHHYLHVFGVSIAIGAIAGLSQANTQYGLNTSAEDAYRQGVATSLSQSSLNILNRYLNVLPTFTIREGHRIKVYLTSDLDLPEYADHPQPADL